MCGHTRLNAMARFGKSHICKDLTEVMLLPRGKSPSAMTIKNEL